MTTYGTSDKHKLLGMLHSRSYKLAPEGQPFTLASGKQSMHFCDVKATIMSAKGLRLATSGLMHATHGIWQKLDCVAGVALGGCPLATAFSLETDLDCLYVRKEAKDHGTGRLVEGTPHALKHGGKVLLVEDVCTTGGSSLRAAESLRSAGFEVSAVAVVVDREEGGGEAVRAAGLEFVRLLTLSEVAQF